MGISDQPPTSPYGMVLRKGSVMGLVFAAGKEDGAVGLMASARAPQEQRLAGVTIWYWDRNDRNTRGSKPHTDGWILNGGFVQQWWEVWAQTGRCRMGRVSGKSHTISLWGAERD